MARFSRILACTTSALAIAAPASAASGDAAGPLKKDAAAATPQLSAPGQLNQTPSTPAAQSPAPQAAPQAAAPQGTPQAQVKAPTASTPVTRGTAKKLASPTSPSVPTAGSGTALSHSSRTSASRRGSIHARSTATQTTARGRAVARGRPHGARVRAHGKAGAPGQQIAAGAPGTAPGQSRSVPATPKPRSAAGGVKPKTIKTHPAPFTTISQAADHVVEIIPGTVVLALTGLAALVIVLVMRSLAVERQRGKALATSYGVTVEALATAIDAKDVTTGGHIERVRQLGLLLAGRIVPREARDPQMAYGFLLHDIGKLAIPDAILCAPGRLTDEQWALMRRHPQEGQRMLSHVPFLDRALDVVLHHHERWDGGGYPDGLAGEQIPLSARIFSVVDALDAMTADRPYRAARSYEEALAEIRRHSGTQFDPRVVDALERIDPALITPLLEPVHHGEPLAELPNVEPLVAV